MDTLAESMENLDQIGAQWGNQVRLPLIVTRRISWWSTRMVVRGDTMRIRDATKALSVQATLLAVQYRAA